MDKKKLAKILGYLGLIPFFSLTVIYFISNFNNYVVDVYLFYANIILAFICGSHWSKILNSNIIENKSLLLILSVCIPFFSFILDFFSNQDVKIAIYVVLFFATNFIDKKIFFETNYFWYLNLRKRLTFLVIFTLVINLFAINSYRFF
ncbi:Protein of unknown function DUF3429 [Candidatus Pelagibacterales bacterium]